MKIGERILCGRGAAARARAANQRIKLLLKGVARRPHPSRLADAPPDYITPSTATAFFTSRGFTHRIAP